MVCVGVQDQCRDCHAVRYIDPVKSIEIDRFLQPEHPREWRSLQQTHDKAGTHRRDAGPRRPGCDGLTPARDGTYQNNPYDPVPVGAALRGEQGNGATH